MTDLLTLSPDALFNNFDLYNHKIEVGVLCRDEERLSACLIRDLRPLFELHTEAMMTDRLKNNLNLNVASSATDTNSELLQRVQKSF